MVLRDFATANYIPLLSVRPAEIKALQELPERDKDRLFPFMFLRPWATAHHLDSALARIDAAYSDHRPVILDIAPAETGEPGDRPVFAQLEQLRDPTSGYLNWCSFVTERTNVVPSLQLAEPAQLGAQAARLFALDRGLVVRLPELALPQGAAIARLLASFGEAGSICIIIDFERASRMLLNRVQAALVSVRELRQQLPGAYIALSASSFPDTFVGVSSQSIFERQFFEGVCVAAGPERLIYSDRGSARAERQTGGGGAPSPRIDYATSEEWQFYRQETAGDRDAAYQTAAQRTMGSVTWDPNLRLWGSQMIERTALGDPDAIISPMRSTSVRINIHLHRQLFYGDAGNLYNTDEDWTD